MSNTTDIDKPRAEDLLEMVVRCVNTIARASETTDRIIQSVGRLQAYVFGLKETLISHWAEEELWRREIEARLQALEHLP